MARTKYKAQKMTWAGETYDSKSEAAFAQQVVAPALAAGEWLYVVRRARFRLGVPENVYECDWLVVTQRYTFAIDVKGTETPKFRRDRKLWAAYGPCPLVVAKPDLRYPKRIPGQPDQIPTIRGWARDVVHGGLDRKVYSRSLHPDWILPGSLQDLVIC